MFKLFKNKNNNIISTEECKKEIELLEKIEQNIRELKVYEIFNYDKQNNKYVSYGYDYCEIYALLLKIRPELIVCNKDLLGFWNYTFYKIIHLPSSNGNLLNLELLYKCICDIYSDIISDYTEN